MLQTCGKRFLPTVHLASQRNSVRRPTVRTWPAVTLRPVVSASVSAATDWTLMSVSVGRYILTFTCVLWLQTSYLWRPHWRLSMSSIPVVSLILFCWCKYHISLLASCSSYSYWSSPTCWVWAISHHLVSLAIVTGHLYLSWSLATLIC